MNIQREIESAINSNKLFVFFFILSYFYTFCKSLLKRNKKLNENFCKLGIFYHFKDK